MDINNIHSGMRQFINYVNASESRGALQNRVMHAIYKAASDLNNLKAAQVPMDMSSTTEEIDRASAIA